MISWEAYKKEIKESSAVVEKETKERINLTIKLADGRLLLLDTKKPQDPNECLIEGLVTFVNCFQEDKREPIEWIKIGQTKDGTPVYETKE